MRNFSLRNLRESVTLIGNFGLMLSVFEKIRYFLRLFLRERVTIMDKITSYPSSKAHLEVKKD